MKLLHGSLGALLRAIGARGVSLVGSVALTAPAMAATISGKVANDEGTPVVGATVYAVHGPSGIIASRHTTSTGEFRISVDRVGEYTVQVAKKGFSPKAAISVQLEDTSVGNLRLGLRSNPAVPPDHLTSADIIPHLPKLDTEVGRRVVESCTNCHSISALIWRGGRSRSDWSATVDRMSQTFGGYFPIQREHREEYVEYLTKQLGPDSDFPARIGRHVAEAPPELRIGDDVTFTEYEIPTPLALAHTAVPDNRGSVWFASFGARNVGRLDIASGRITEYVPKSAGTLHPHGITVGPDGVIWYTAMPFGIGRIDPKSGEMQEYKAPDPTEAARNSPHTIIVAKDGNVWFTELENGSISKFDPVTKKFTRYPIETRSGPYGILEREDNVFWFMLREASKVGYLNANTGEIKTYPTPTRGAWPQRLRFDSRGRLWFGELRAGKIGMFDAKTEKIVEYDLPTGGSAYCVHIDGEDRIWVASTYRESLIRFDPSTKEMVEYPLPGQGTDGEVLGAIIRDIWPDEEGRMWFVEWSRNKVASAEIMK